MEKDEKFKYFVNKECEYYPCHENVPEEKWSCLFCYCPLYLIDDCGGNYSILDNGVKNCMDCTLPHQRQNWEYIVNKLNERNTKIIAEYEKDKANK